MSANSLLPPPEHVLSTLEQDGSRRWLEPRLSKGRMLTARRAVAYVLIALYTLIPFVEVGGQPLMLFDIPARHFIIFGYTFLPTDTLLLALFAVAALLGVFFLTALFGRAWCGWACPQTVYLEFVFRPIERLFAGTAGRGGHPRQPTSAPMLALRFAVWAAVAFVLANTFLAYFIGVDTLGEWMMRSPIQHPVPFLIMAGLTVAMLVNFTWFREQMCTLACPYGRLQSVLLDRDSVIVSYDKLRGDPRGKPHKGQTGQGATGKGEITGDCIDCGLCVKTCPTGIDIRDGLQMECIGCAQCIDACAPVMTKLGRPPNLIRFSSQRADAGERRRVLRPRVVIYPLIISVLVALFVVTLAGKQSFDAVILRNPGQPFTLTDDGDVRNVLRLKATSRTDADLELRVVVREPTGVELVGEPTFSLPTGDVETFPLTVVADPALFVTGEVPLRFTVQGDDGSTRELAFTLLGPTARRSEGQ
jgi:cytochrome c oxidase accessory protein FixG